MSAPAIQITSSMEVRVRRRGKCRHFLTRQRWGNIPRRKAPPAVAPVVTPRKGVAVALLLSLGLHAIVILALIDWFTETPESPSIVRATLARVAEPSAAPGSPASTMESEEVRPVAQPLPETREPESSTAAEAPAAEEVVNVVGARLAPESPDRSLDYATTVRRIANLDTSNVGAEPRIRRIVDGRTETSEDDWYFESWRRKVERIGKLNYPEQARAQKIYGSLRLLVAIEPDGSLRDVRVIDSSGHKVLDEAAVRIVQLAAPYAPFPPAMRKDTDVLEIVRTWQFKKRGSAPPS